MDDNRAVERREDAALVEQARAGDPDAFGRLYDRWFDRVHDLAFRITNDTAAASDVAQDALLAAWQKLGTLEDPEAFGGWLLRITRNAALDRHRREQRARAPTTRRGCR
jgi:RNA polymerase sigma-70 factor (ECF subfamily)